MACKIEITVWNGKPRFSDMVENPTFSVRPDIQRQIVHLLFNHVFVHDKKLYKFIIKNGVLEWFLKTRFGIFYLCQRYNKFTMYDILAITPCCPSYPLFYDFIYGLHFYDVYVLIAELCKETKAMVRTWIELLSKPHPLIHYHVLFASLEPR